MMFLLWERDIIQRVKPVRTLILGSQGLRGVLLSIPTPFDAAGEVNHSALRANITSGVKLAFAVL
ncbi:MAG: hypothetical protein M3R69_09735 [Acidobacteriota bacterium]|nr:hypothetical protein [Acidobacteriota bacterium]